MYGELVKRLREADVKSMCGECGLNLHTGATKKGVLFAEAADAIAELSEYANTIMRLKSEGWYLQQTKNDDSYAAAATMPLPEPPKEET